MRQLTLLLFAMLLCMPVFSKQKIRVEKVEPDSTTEEVVAYRTRANHWSLSGHVGVGILDGDQKQAFSVIFPRSVKNLNFGINLEYSINPIWGVYLEYLYNPYGGNAPYIDGLTQFDPVDRVDFRGINHEGVLGVSVNFLNLFSRCRKQVFNWYANVGIGASIFKITEHPHLQDANHWLPTWEKGKGRDGRSMSIPIGTTLEVNATRWLAILLNVQYRMHFQDIYDGAIRGNSNDNLAYAGLGLRWKINSLSHRNYDHVRNMAMCTWEQSASEKLAQDNSKRIDSLAGRVDYLNVRFNALEPRVRALEKDMETLRDSDGDGVPDIRDRHPNTPPNTLVNYYGEPIYGDSSSGKSYAPDNKYHDGDASNTIRNLDDIDGDGVPNVEVHVLPSIPFTGNKSNIPDNKYINGDPKRVIKNIYDINGNGIPDYLEFGANDDLDGDGIPNSLDPDIDGDGIPNEEDTTPYGVYAYRSQNGSLVYLTYDPDIDGDGIPNEKDDDIDGDGIPNNVDPTMYGYVNIPAGLKPKVLSDKYHNGDITKPIKDPYDVNGDGKPNSQQMGMHDDLDGDGIPNYLDNDIDGDGIPNAIDPTPYGAMKEGSGSSSSYGPGYAYGAGAGVNSGNGYNVIDTSFKDEEGLAVYFATGKYDISTASQTVLSTIARRMEAHPNYTLEIHGYCDEQGERSNFQNQKLSENRAKKVRDTLVNKYKVAASRIKLVVGHGAVEGAPTIDFLPNRRVDMIFVR